LNPEGQQESEKTGSQDNKLHAMEAAQKYTRPDLLSSLRNVKTCSNSVTLILTTLSNSYSSSSSSSVGATARCGLWPVQKYLSICPYLSPTLSIFSLPTLEDFFPLLLSILSWVFLFVSSLPVLE
jgi:hypothetical protein